MKTFLCTIVDRASKEVLAEYTILDDHWYFAKNQAAAQFEQTNDAQNWKVECVEID